MAPRKPRAAAVTPSATTTTTPAPYARPDRTDQEIHVTIARDRLHACDQRDEPVQLYRDYCKGRHALQLTEHQQRILQGLLNNKFCENLARKIVADNRDRLRFVNWTCESTPVQEWLSNFYKLAGVAKRQGKVHFETLRDGNHGIAVNWDNDDARVKLYREPWWNGLEGLFIAYDHADDMVYAVKDWICDVEGQAGAKALRRVIYFPDRMERWVSYDGGASFEHFIMILVDPVTQQETEEPWPAPWLDENGEPLGIPIVHFKDTGQGDDIYGASELSGGVIGLIDQINDLHYVMSGGARVTGYPIVTAAGITLQKNANSPTGYDEPTMTPGTMLWSTDPDAKFGQIQAGNFDGLKLVRGEKLNALSVTTQTPLYSITGGDYPSGEALMRADQPLVGKATTQKDTLESAWSEVGHIATKIHNAFSSEAKLDTDVTSAMVEANFDPVERRDLLTKSVIVSNVGQYISEEEVLRIMNYSEDEVAKIMKEKKANAADSAKTQALLFSRGVGQGTDNLPGRGPATGEPTDSNASNAAASNGNSGPSRGGPQAAKAK